MSWPTVSASELMLQRGGSVNPAKFPDETFELFSIPAFDKGEPEIAEGKLIGSSKSCIQPNDVLLSRIVPHIKRCWVVPLPQGDYRQIGSGEWIIFRSEKVFPQFLKHFLTSEVFHRQFMNTVAGVGGSLVRARPAQVGNIQIPLPPLPEQKRIAAILDKADAIRRKRQQAIQLADDFLRAVFLNMFGDPVTNPRGWEVRPLGDVLKLSSGNGLTAKEINLGGCYPVYGGNGINGYHSEYMFKEPQLVIGRVGAYCGVIHITQPFSWVTDNALYIREFLQDVNVHYLAQLLEISNLNQYAGKAAQPLVSGNRIYPLKMIFPPLQEQSKFEEMKKKYIDSMKAVDCALLEIESMFNSLSQKAFAGKL